MKISQLVSLPITWIAALLAPSATVHSREPDASAASIASVGSLLAGRYENSAQVAQGEAAATLPAPQHVTITIESTPKLDWQLWHIHMDVDPAVARSAGSETSLDAEWAMNVVRQHDKALSLIPYTSRSSANAAAIQGRAFDESEWLSLEACMLRGTFARSRIVVQQSVDEMCAAEGMGLGGKRAFLPISVDGDGERLQVQLIFFGEPWRVDARRVSPGGA